MYRITRIIGNNFVCSLDDAGEEIVLSGKGIGFKRQKGDIIPPSAIENIYTMHRAENRSKLMELVAEVPLEQISVCTRIIEEICRRMNKTLAEHIYITLTDHISFALARKARNIEYSNGLLLEIKNFYPVEFQMGQYAVDQIAQELGVQLSEDEAGFVALHIVNAELDTGMTEMVKITEMIQAIVTTVRNYYGIRLDESSLDYGRFIVHLKYLGQRIARKDCLEEQDPELLMMMKRRYPRDFTCASRIQRYVERHFDCTLSENELIFLTVHLHRVSQSENEIQCN